MGLILRTVSASDPGLIRLNNEDCAFAGRRLAAVADGMGGMPSGELASDIVINSLRPLEAAADDGDPVDALLAAIDTANDDIRAVAEADRAQEGMGTTVTALLAGPDGLALLHVGDSRCYHLGDGGLRLITRDDTFVQALVDQGILTPAEARTHPRRSVVTQAVQGYDMEPSCTELSPRVGDRYLLCSDGLSDVVTEEAIGQVLRGQSDATECARQLIALALAGGGPDNITVVIADVVAD